MSEFTFEKATLKDARYVAEHLREEDFRECFGLSGDHCLEEAEGCINLAEIAYVCKCDGVPLCIFGVIRDSIFANIGVVFMLSTSETKNHKYFIGKWTKRVMKAFLQEWETLYNWVDMGNERTIAWLKWLGAEIDPPLPYGIFGIKYHKFTFRRR